MILVSGCLCGINCKYNGKNNLNPKIKSLYDLKLAIPICPEVLGGLTTPRIPSEIINDRVINKDGIDVTDNFILGAKRAVEIALNNNIKMAILKDGSPSCGVNYIYDGTFSGTKIKGLGVFSRELLKKDVKIVSENDINDLGL